FSDPSETALTNDLQKLSQQIGDAVRALGTGQPSSKDAELSHAMDDLSRLRDQISSSMGRSPNPQSGQGQPGQGKQGRPGQQYQLGQLSRGGGQSGQQQGQGNQGGQNGQNPQAGQQGQNGGTGNRLADLTGNPGGGSGDRNSTVYGNLDTGNTRIEGRAV